MEAMTLWELSLAFWCCYQLWSLAKYKRTESSVLMWKNYSQMPRSWPCKSFLEPFGNDHEWQLVEKSTATVKICKNYEVSYYFIQRMSKNCFYIPDCDWRSISSTRSPSTCWPLGAQGALAPSKQWPVMGYEPSVKNFRWSGHPQLGYLLILHANFPSWSALSKVHQKSIQVIYPRGYGV